MSFTTPRTWSPCEVVTSQLLNVHIKDNFNETAPAKATTKGDIFAATGANAIARVAAGGDGAFLCASTGCNAGVRWTTDEVEVNFSASLLDVNNRIRIMKSASGFGELSLTPYNTTDSWRVLWDDGSGAGMGTACSLQIWLGSTRHTALTTNGTMHINDAANANMTTGLTINQGAATDEIIALKSSTLAHLFTGVTEADTFGALKKAHTDSGGLRVTGIAEAGGGGTDRSGLVLEGITNNAQATNSTAASGIVAFRAWTLEGVGSAGSPSGAANAFTWQSGSRTCAILDGAGELYLDAGSNASAFDAYADAPLLRAMDVFMSDPATVVESRFVDWMQYGRSDIERAGLVTFNDHDGHHFMNVGRIVKALVGAEWQGYERQRALEQENAQLRAALVGLVGELSVRTGSHFALPAALAAPGLDERT